MCTVTSGPREVRTLTFLYWFQKYLQPALDLWSGTEFRTPTGKRGQSREQDQYLLTSWLIPYELLKQREHTDLSWLKNGRQMQWCFMRNSHLKVIATITDEQSNTGNRDPRVFTPLSYSSCAWTAFNLIFLELSSLPPCNCRGRNLTLWRIKLLYILSIHTLSAYHTEYSAVPFEIPIPLCRREIKVFLVRNIKIMKTRGRQNVELLVLNLAVYRTHWSLGCDSFNRTVMNSFL